MEKTWNDFWMTGKVEDYLTYKNNLQEEEKQKFPQEKEKEQKGQNIYGTIGGSYRNGAK